MPRQFWLHRQFIGPGGRSDPCNLSDAFSLPARSASTLGTMLPFEIEASMLAFVGASGEREIREARSSNWLDDGGLRLLGQWD